MKIFRVAVALVLLVYGFVPAVLVVTSGRMLPAKYAAHYDAIAGWPVYLFLGVWATLTLVAAWQLAFGKGRVLPCLLALLKLPLAFLGGLMTPLFIPALYLLAETAYPFVGKRRRPLPVHPGLDTFRKVASLILGLYGLVPFLALGTMWSVIQRKYQEDFHKPLSWEGLAVFAGFCLLFTVSAFQLWKGKGRGFAWFGAVIIAPFALMGSIGVVLAAPLLYLAAEALRPYVFKEQPPDEKTLQLAKTSKGQMIEWAITIPVIFAAVSLSRDMPGVITPDNARSGFLMFVAYTWVIIFVHELGHAWTGAFLGFEWMAFAVFPFEIQRAGGKTHIKWNTNPGGHYAGFPKTADNLWRRHLIMVAGGPAVNIATFFLLWIVLWQAHGAIDGYAFGFLRGLMVWSLITAVGNLVPVKVANLKTDGRYIWDSFFAPVESRKSLAVYGCMISRSSPLRPRDWKPEWVNALRDGEQDLATAALLSAWAQDKLLADPVDLEAMAALQTSTEDLERLAGALPKPQGSSIRFHVDWLRWRYDGIVDKQVAEHMAAARKDKATDPYELLRMEAALKLADGDTASAASLLDRAEADMAQRQSGFRVSDLDDLRAFRAAACVEG